MEYKPRYEDDHSGGESASCVYTMALEPRGGESILEIRLGPSYLDFLRHLSENIRSVYLREREYYVSKKKACHTVLCVYLF
jgi:hypothetical protein